MTAVYLEAPQEGRSVLASTAEMPALVAELADADQ